MNETSRTDPLDPLAAGFGIDPPSAVALMTVAHRGLSTPGDLVVDHLERVPLAPLHVGLVDDAGLGSGVLKGLLQQALNYQKVLSERFARIDPGVLKEVWERGGAGTVGQGVPQMPEGERLKDQQELVFGIAPDQFRFGDGGMGSSEMTEKSGYTRVDLALRPRFVVENASPAHLRKELGRCNQACGFFPGGPGLRVEGLSGRNLDEVVGVMDGVRVPLPELLCGGSPGATEPSGATVLVEGGDEGWLRTGLEPLLDRVLLVRPEARRFPEGFDHGSFQGLLRNWKRHLHSTLDRRRWGCGTITDLGASFEDMEEFARRNHDHVARCREEGISNPSVLGLPRAVMVVFRGCWPRTAPAALLPHVFHHAGELLDRHVAVLRRLRGESGVLRVIGQATKLHRRLGDLEQKAPGGGQGGIRFRELVRGFDVQRKEVHQPVLDVMKRAGLVIEDADGMFRSGPEGDIDAAIRKAMARDRLRLVA